MIFIILEISCFIFARKYVEKHTRFYERWNLVTPRTMFYPSANTRYAAFILSSDITINIIIATTFQSFFMILFSFPKYCYTITIYYGLLLQNSHPSSMKREKRWIIEKIGQRFWDLSPFQFIYENIFISFHFIFIQKSYIIKQSIWIFIFS